MSDQDVSKMKVADLKRELKIRGLNVTGNKNELAERLQSALIEGDVLDDTAISEELLDDNDDVLNDDELDEETKSYLNSTVHDEDAILSSPKGSSKSPENLPESSTSSSSAPIQQKKVVLKRKLLPSVSFTESDVPTTTTDSKHLKMDDFKVSADGQSSNDDAGNSNVVKVGQLSIKERLELRAKKFGVPASSDAAKLARAERFGVTNTAETTDTNKKSVGSISQHSAPSVDLLKKRAERFGNISNTMVKIEQNEKLLKRQERFGAATNVDAKTTVSTQAANDYAEKAKLRLERFKTVV